MSSFNQTSPKGFSLVEVMVTIVIAGILMGIVSSNFPQLKRVADRFLGQAFYEEQYLIFLLKLEDEYHHAVHYNPQGAAQIGQLVFEQDYNLDGDLNDSGERIAYRWNQKEKRIDRKSGSGYFQALLEGVTAFSWKQVKDDPACHELQVQSVFSSLPRPVLYCMNY